MKNKLVLCELYHEKFHGFSKEFSDPSVKGQYIVIEEFTSFTDDFSEYEDEDDYSHADDDNESIYSIASLYQARYIMFYRKYGDRIKHSLLRNYAKIISNEHYIKPEIAECFYLKGDEYIAILKTFWIRIIQRCWRKTLEKRKKIIQLWKSPKNIFHKERTGKWPSDCSIYPSLRGMLANL
jgi:hypothetical protein